MVAPVCAQVQVGIGASLRHGAKQQLRLCPVLQLDLVAIQQMEPWHAVDDIIFVVEDVAQRVATKVQCCKQNRSNKYVGCGITQGQGGKEAKRDADTINCADEK
jgi:hypothetical protein